jgi:hypothetical protein
MPGEKRSKAEPEGWTPQEKGTGAEGAGPQGDAGAAGEAAPKARPTDDRAATESAAARVERDGGPTDGPAGGGKR